MPRYISRLPSHEWQSRDVRPTVVLGSTGSIGRSTLAVMRLQAERFPAAALAGGNNLVLLAEQAAEFRPPLLAILDPARRAELRALLPLGYAPEVLAGPEGYVTLSTLPEAAVVVCAQSGAAGLEAALAAAKAGKVIALANKESLVLAGRLIRAACAASGASILPVDSEHNAIFQCLSECFAASDEASTAGPELAGVQGLVLTASGGPFRDHSAEQLAAVTPEEALRHPNWSMGPKITVDSSTMMNKGLEIIEAHHLYAMPLERIQVRIHRESIVHSLVEYADGSQLAHLSRPDMRIAVAHCLGYPRRIRTEVPRLDLPGSLSFEAPDDTRFPCLRLARQAQAAGGGSPVVLNAANEIAVDAFLRGRISWPRIASLVDEALAEYAGTLYGTADTLEGILALDAETRIRVQRAPGVA